MFWRVYKEELFKIFRSYGFKIAFISILILSTFNIINEYVQFKDYDILSAGMKNEYSKLLESYQKELKSIESNKSYFKNSKQREIEENIVKYHIDYYSKNIPPVLHKDFSQGITRCIFRYQIFLSLILLFCSGSVCYEKNNNIIFLQFSTEVEKRVLYNSKYLSMFTAALIIFIFNITYSFLLSVFIMGINDLSAPIQTIHGCSKYCIQRTIFELIIIRVAFAILSMAIAIVVFQFISTISKNVFTSYILSASIVVSSRIFYINNWFDNYTLFSSYEIFSAYETSIIFIDIKKFLVIAIVQTVLLYILGLYFYKKIE